MKKAKSQEISLVQSKENKVLLLILFVISRLMFVNTQPVFFDSPEYIRRMSYPNFFNALIQGHLPLHSGYLLFTWPIYHLSRFFHLPPTYMVILFQIILSFLAIIAFYQTIKQLFNQNIALLASVILSFIPIFWISSITIMMEGVYMPFFFILVLLSRFRN